MLNWLLPVFFIVGLVLMQLFRQTGKSSPKTDTAPLRGFNNYVSPPEPVMHDMPIKPMAIVFPQYHAIPENDKFWGANFTEWTLLKPLQRVVNGFVIKKPHQDIGYYNFLDYNHRKYMRIMADHFGVYGFCFYHYWFENRPVMNKVMLSMITDGEPNKPFFFCWANEQWTRRWDGGNHDILIRQDYSNEQGNINHFLYLIQFFEHRNYLRVDGKPMFSFYRIEPEDQDNIRRIMILWQRLALEHGLPGIHFVRFFGPFNNNLNLEDIKGVIQFEPGYSWQQKGGGPSIFPNGVFDEKIFLENNPDLKDIPNLNLKLSYDRPSELYRSSQFKIYDGNKTLQTIESREFVQTEYYRGTVFSWNNAPRRNFTNGNYVAYPHYIEPVAIEDFESHLSRLVDKTFRDKVPNKYIFLTAWNEWNEQSMIEPNDVDGYNALLAVRKVVRAKNGARARPHGPNRILHVSHLGGGTEKYIRDLMSLFDEYNHQYLVPPAKVPLPPPSDVVLIHIHSVMVMPGCVGWNITSIVEQYRWSGVRIYLTIHDYQWLFPDNPNPPLEFLHSTVPSEQNAMLARRLFSLVDRIIFPSVSVQTEFLRFLSPSAQITKNWVVVPHCDSLVSPSILAIPQVKDRVINIAFIGLFTEYKGSKLFLELVTKYGRLGNKNTGSEPYRLVYHVFGEDIFDPNCVTDACNAERAARKRIVFHGTYKHDQIFSDLQKHDIHILIYLSPFPETFSYAFTLGLNSGLAIVYLDRGSLKERIQASRQLISLKRAAAHKYFDARSDENVMHSIRQAVKFVLTNAGREEGYRPRTYRVQPNRWYLSNYPFEK